MLMSMTGYCSLTEQISLQCAGTISMTIEIKTLNGRFFEVVPKLASSLGSLEMPMASLLQEKLIRGKVYLNARFDDKQRSLAVITPSWSVIDQYVSATQAIKEKYKLAGELVISDLVQLPNVLVAEENALTQSDGEVILALIAKAADKVVSMRMEEGKRLEKDFQSLFALCAEKIVLVEKSFKEATAHYTELIKQALAAHTDPNAPNVLAEELQVTLKKLDIHEEITRFRSHLESIAPILQSPNREKGKRLDFILQELMRETNTTMAKCSAAYQVSALCIDIKVALEKAREQIQNIV